MARLIDADALYAKVQEGEELARKRVLDTESTLPFPTNLNPAYTRYSAQMDERTKLKHMIADAPTVDVPDKKIGKWVIRVIWPPDGEDCYCSECGKGECLPNWKYCPYCGAKMEVDYGTAD